jgi:3-methyl-2-oxobutanoate hydroxymethyltransferase
MLGINKEFRPRFVRRYAEMADQMHQAVANYVADVKAKDFPNSSEMY